MSSSEWHKIVFRSNERRFMGIASRKAKRGKSMRWRMLNLKFKIFAKKNTIYSLFIIRTNKNVDKINYFQIKTEINLLNRIDISLRIFTVEPLQPTHFIKCRSDTTTKYKREEGNKY